MPVPNFSPNQIIAVEVFLERFQTRIFVGTLTKMEKQFYFSYDSKYLNMENVLPLGPEFPLTQQEFSSLELFPSFQDRLPDPENPSYVEHCTSAGIAVTTTDPIVLLTRIGKRGPSSFIFEPLLKNKYDYKDIEKLKNDLNISLQDFANVLGVSLSSLQKIKTGDASGKEVLKQVELYLEKPEALEFQIQRNSKWLHAEKTKEILKFLEGKKINKWKILSYEECNYVQECLSVLQSCDWAKELTEKINELGFLPASMPIMFEIRFAYALHKAGLSVQNEYRAGTKNSEIKDSSVDFLVTENDIKWLIELTSLDESVEVKKSTWTEGDFFGCTLKDPVKLIRRAQGAIFEKSAKFKGESRQEALPTKFPIPQPGEYNIIIIDMRGFAIGNPDKHDYESVVKGENDLKGIFCPSHPDLRSKYLQERIHGVGFISESQYAEGEIQTILELFPNPKFFKNAEELRELFPLKKGES